MDKLEKVIRGLERCIEKLDTVTNKAHGFNCTACPFFSECDSTGYLVGLPLMRDALALLKAQEPVEPTIGRCEEYDGHDSWWYQCGKCETPIDVDDNYCRNCGQAVRWE